MDVDPQEHNLLSTSNGQVNLDELTSTMDSTAPPRGEVLKILDQTIHDGGAVKYTVLWENGDTTEESVEALGKWDDLVQDYEHSQFSKSEVKSHTPSPPPSRKPQQSLTKSDGDASKRRSSVTSRPTRTKARAPVQYYEGDDSDDGAEYTGPRTGKKLGSKAKKAASSSDDVQDQDMDPDASPAPTVSTRSYPRRAQASVKSQPVLDSSDDSSEEVTPSSKQKAERKIPSAPKQKKALVATSTESSFVQAHHPFCSRCGQRGEIAKRKSKKKSDDEEDDEPLGSLLLCECCSVGYHRSCLRKTYTDSLIGTGFRCEACIKNKGAECLECREWVGRTPSTSTSKPSDTNETPTDTPAVVEGAKDVVDGSKQASATPVPESDASRDMDVDKDPNTDSPATAADTPTPSTPAPDADQILFRCFRCTYTAHEKCLRPLSTMDARVDRATVIRQYRKDWKCHQCQEWDRELDLILAFRDVPIRRSNSAAQDDDTEMTPADSTKSEASSALDAKDGSTFPQPANTTRELLVKWKNASYRKVTWVPCYWVSQVAPAKLKSFWKKTVGPAETSEVVMTEWTEVDKVLDVVFDTDYDGTEDDMDAIDHIQSVFVKWRGLDYDQATWDEPDEPDSSNYASFKQSFKEWVAAQKIDIPARAKKGRVNQTRLNQGPFEELKSQPGYISGGTLKDYQMDGLNWLRYNHWKNVNSILADEMGLGKTIQMVAFVTTLFHELRAFPCLIVVPNSTLTNWVREFAKWAPDLRVVAYCGPQNSRTVVRDYELFHRGTHDLKCHVVVTTYEMIVNPADSSLFRKNSWECLVVDEGQRLKNENSMLFVKLNELVIESRVLLTGTPLQNNIRELFSLMNFLDPVKFSDVTELEKKYENLDKAAVEELHGLLKPFFLRRTKDEVLKDLPPKSEVIVPVGMSALQKEIYKGILARNHKLLQSITNRGGTASTRKASLHNILMELRKCLNHPYLIEGVEPQYLDTAELVQKSLIEAGGKLELLHNMLPKLKQNGHRVLIFSTMTRLLDILEDYLNGEHYNFVRLDGGTSNAERQARIDKFNAPDSDVFVFLLSTRAGGVGVNLATADTIIIYDVDFNPKADMQALSRAHRIGQKNKVLVLKFMTRNSAEERIVQIGKKKMILDHLIVERMEDDNLDPVDVESILKFGAKALFEEETTTNEDLKYDDAALEALLDRSKIEHNWEETDGESKVSGFGFAKVWTDTKGIVDEEIPIDAPPENEEEGFWSTLLRDRLAMAYAQEEELLGRGARRKTVLSYAENGNNNESPPNRKRKAGKDAPSKEEEEYIDQEGGVSDVDSAVSDDEELDPNVIMGELEIKRSKKNKSPLVGDMDAMDEDGRRDAFGPQDGVLGQGGKMKKARMQAASPYLMQPGAGGPGGRGLSAMDKKGGRKPQPCLVCHRSHRDRCPESQDIPLVLERRQQIATSSYPDNYKVLALATLDRFLLDKQITPSELPKGKLARNLSIAAARLGNAAYQDNLWSMSIGKPFVPTITPGSCIVCNQTPYHLPFKCPEMKNVQFMQERCRSITLDPTISDSKKQEYVSTIKALISRESPRGNSTPASSTTPSSRRQGQWGGTSNSTSGPPAPAPHGSSRGPSSSASGGGAPPHGGSGQASVPSKHSGTGQRSSHGQPGQHQSYGSQAPSQYVGSRPKDSHHGSLPASSATSGTRSDGQRPRDYGSPPYPPPRGGVPPHHSSSGPITSGARESSNYQSRKQGYRNEDGSAPPGRSAGYGPSGSGGRGGPEYGYESSRGDAGYDRERDRGGYSSRHDVHPERERDRDRMYMHHEGREDGPRSQSEYSRTDNGLYSSGARSSHERSSQHHSGMNQHGSSSQPPHHSSSSSSHQYQEHSNHSSQHHFRQGHSSQSSSQQGGVSQQHMHSSSSRPRPVSMSPRDDHRVLGQPSGPLQYSMDRHGSHSQHDSVVDLAMTSPTLDSQSSQAQENYHHSQQHRQGRPMNGESDHGQGSMISPETSPHMERSTKADLLDVSSSSSSSYGQGGLVAAAASESDRPERSEGFRMETGGGGIAGLKEKYHHHHHHHHSMRTGDMGKIDLTSELPAEESMGPEALTAELRINEPRKGYVDS
ncbi:hypothetical protein B0O80DRAFT_500215 [Mortierella sp. GBAus27b]|nr:hypothetical protein B0O80DRAFT_500215 [Mortierella sp. GBAus27b]